MADHKVALVTGGASGIGAAIAAALAGAGFRVAIIDKDAAGVAARAASIGGETLAITADCGEFAAIQAAFGQVDASFGRVDVLVNNAGHSFQSSLLDLDEQGWELISRVNLKGAFFTMQAAAKRMVDQGSGGRIVNIGSISGRGYPKAANPAYVASKGGLVALTWYAAHQLACHDINVNAVCPGVTMTPLMRSAMSQRAERAGTDFETALDAMRSEVPLGRFNEPDDIAAMVLFLCGEGGRNITGQAINVDGGLVAN